jgi:xanthine dehydrogenase YagR molybdenum-binding subunit
LLQQSFLMNDSAIFTPVQGGVVGQALNRVDGHAKVTGTAKYAAEYNLPGLVHAVFKTSDVAKGRIQRIDTSEAQKQPGVVAILTHENLPKLAKTPNAKADQKTMEGVMMGFMPLTSSEIFYAGQPVAIVVASTFEQATLAAARLKIDYQVAAPIASYRSPQAVLFDPQETGDGADLRRQVRGNPQAALAAAAVQVTATYTHSINHHNPMEPGATTAHWEAPDRLTVYDSTQSLTLTQQTLATMLGLPQDQVRVVCKFIGGGFGSKYNVWPHTVLATLAAKAVQRPVKLVLTRPQNFTGLGHREDQEQTLTLGATQEGKLTAILHEKTSTTSPFDNSAEPNGEILNWLYACGNYQSSYRLAKGNTMTPTYMRAPGEAPGSFALECAMDDLAAKLGLDPLQIRLRNYAERDPATGHAWSSKSLRECYARGAELMGWSQRNPQPGLTREGKYLVGMGMASGSYPVHPGQATARARLFADGHAVVQCGASDLGTGTYTVMTQVAADALGLPPQQVRFELGDTNLPTGPAAGGSKTAAIVSSAVHLSIQDLWQRLARLAIRDSKSPLFRARPEDVVAENGRLVLRQNKQQGEGFAAIMQRAQLSDIEGSATSKSGQLHEAEQLGTNPQLATPRAMYSFGAHFCEVRVDPELGTVRVSRWVSVIGAGRVLNPKTARSQIIGGSIMGIGAALTEATNRDEQFARYTNASLADYHVPVNADIPNMTVEFIDEHDPYVNAMGVKGIGEVAIVGVSAAVANAVFHATGRRIRSLPITPDKVLAALRQPV